ncbi:hypothetical protein RRF57_009568 [Xylaria bambusicola]|uniref:Uncharacterized protein n=1 Tax=Xylaria bambusicola TaxID=326684 RepID=A0AAN7UZL2_9PEZI
MNRNSKHQNSANAKHARRHKDADIFARSLASALAFPELAPSVERGLNDDPPGARDAEEDHVRYDDEGHEDYYIPMSISIFLSNPSPSPCLLYCRSLNRSLTVPAIFTFYIFHLLQVHITTRKNTSDSTVFAIQRAACARSRFLGGGGAWAGSPAGSPAPCNNLSGPRLLHGNPRGLLDHSLCELARPLTPTSCAGLVALAVVQVTGDLGICVVGLRVLTLAAAVVLLRMNNGGLVYFFRGALGG